MIVNAKVSCDADMHAHITYPPDNDNDIQVNHLNPVDEAMIADASCRLVAGEPISCYWVFLVAGELISFLLLLGFSCCR